MAESGRTSQKREQIDLSEVKQNPNQAGRYSRLLKASLAVQKLLLKNNCINNLGHFPIIRTLEEHQSLKVYKKNM